MKKITRTAYFNVGFLSGTNIEELHRLCRRYDVEVVRSEKIGGVLVKRYRLTLRGTPFSLQMLKAMARYFSDEL